MSGRETKNKKIDYSSEAIEDFDIFDPLMSAPLTQIELDSLQEYMDFNRESLEKKLMLRRTLPELVDQGIYPKLNTPLVYAEKCRQLEQAKARDSLQKKLKQRPDMECLIQHHILEDTNLMADQSLQEKQRLMKKLELRENLNDYFSHRPGPLDLLDKNILRLEDESLDSFTGENKGSVDTAKVVDDWGRGSIGELMQGLDAEATVSENKVSVDSQLNSSPPSNNKDESHSIDLDDSIFLNSKLFADPSLLSSQPFSPLPSNINNNNNNNNSSLTDNSSSTISIINNDSNISFSSNILNNTTTSHQAINNVTMQGNNVATANLQKPNDTNIFITNNDSIALQATIPPPPDITPLLIQQNFNNNMWSLSSQSQFKSTMPPPSLPTLSPSSLASTATSYRQQKSQKKMRCKNVSKPKQIKFHEYKGPPGTVKSKPKYESLVVLKQQQEQLIKWQISGNQNKVPIDQYKPPTVSISNTHYSQPSNIDSNLRDIKTKILNRLNSSSSQQTSPHSSFQSSPTSSFQPSPHPSIQPSPHPSPCATPPSPSFMHLSNLKTSDLRTICKASNLTASGSKQQLLKRLTDFYNISNNISHINQIENNIASNNNSIKSSSNSVSEDNDNNLEFNFNNVPNSNNVFIDPSIRRCHSVNLDEGSCMEAGLNSRYSCQFDSIFSKKNAQELNDAKASQNAEGIKLTFNQLLHLFNNGGSNNNNNNNRNNILNNKEDIYADQGQDQKNNTTFTHNNFNNLLKLFDSSANNNNNANNNAITNQLKSALAKVNSFDSFNSKNNNNNTDNTLANFNEIKSRFDLATGAADFSKCRPLFFSDPGDANNNLNNKNNNNSVQLASNSEEFMKSINKNMPQKFENRSNNIFENKIDNKNFSPKNMANNTKNIENNNINNQIAFLQHRVKELEHRLQEEECKNQQNIQQNQQQELLIKFLVAIINNNSANNIPNIIKGVESVQKFQLNTRIIELQDNNLSTSGSHNTNNDEKEGSIGSNTFKLLQSRFENSNQQQKKLMIQQHSNSHLHTSNYNINLLKLNQNFKGNDNSNNFQAIGNFQKNSYEKQNLDNTVYFNNNNLAQQNAPNNTNFHKLLQLLDQNSKKNNTNNNNIINSTNTNSFVQNLLKDFKNAGTLSKGDIEMSKQYNTLSNLNLKDSMVMVSSDKQNSTCKNSQMTSHSLDDVMEVINNSNNNNNIFDNNKHNKNNNNNYISMLKNHFDNLHGRNNNNNNMNNNNNNFNNNININNSNNFSNINSNNSNNYNNNNINNNNFESNKNNNLNNNKVSSQWNTKFFNPLPFKHNNTNDDASSLNQVMETDECNNHSFNSNNDLNQLDAMMHTPQSVLEGMDFLND